MARFELLARAESRRGCRLYFGSSSKAKALRVLVEATAAEVILVGDAVLASLA
jgi:hypothetical protein